MHQNKYNYKAIQCGAGFYICRYNDYNIEYISKKTKGLYFWIPETEKAKIYTLFSASQIVSRLQRIQK